MRRTIEEGDIKLFRTIKVSKAEIDDCLSCGNYRFLAIPEGVDIDDFDREEFCIDDVPDLKEPIVIEITD